MLASRHLVNYLSLCWQIFMKMIFRKYQQWYLNNYLDSRMAAHIVPPVWKQIGIKPAIFGNSLLISTCPPPSSKYKAINYQKHEKKHSRNLHGQCKSSIMFRIFLNAPRILSTVGSILSTAAQKIMICLENSFLDKASLKGYSQGRRNLRE